MNLILKKNQLINFHYKFIILHFINIFLVFIELNH